MNFTNKIKRLLPKGPRIIVYLLGSNLLFYLLVVAPKSKEIKEDPQPNSVISPIPGHVLLKVPLQLFIPHNLSPAPIKFTLYNPVLKKRICQAYLVQTEALAHSSENYLSLSEQSSEMKTLSTILVPQKAVPKILPHLSTQKTLWALPVTTLLIKKGHQYEIRY